MGFEEMVEMVRRMDEVLRLGEWVLKKEGKGKKG